MMITVQLAFILYLLHLLSNLNIEHHVQLMI